MSAGTNNADSEWEVFPQNDWHDICVHTSPCPLLSGCTDPISCNFDPAATVDDGSCDYTCLGCTDPSANNYDSTATMDDG